MHKKFLKNTKGTHKISQEVHKKFKRDFMKVWCTRTIYCDPQKKTLYVRPQRKYQNTSKPVFKITPNNVHTFMQFEMRLNTFVLRIKSQATLYSSEEFSPAIAIGAVP